MGPTRRAILLLLLWLPACGMGGFTEDYLGDEFDTPAGESMTPGERDLAREVLALMNAERAREELPPLAWDETAADAAYDHCVDMRLRGFYAHVNPDGDGPCERLMAAGVDLTYCSSENIARHNRTPEDVMAAWLASPSHREVIFAPGPTHVGIGVHTGKGGPWWVQDFFIRLE